MPSAMSQSEQIVKPSRNSTPHWGHHIVRPEYTDCGGTLPSPPIDWLGNLRSKHPEGDSGESPHKKVSYETGRQVTKLRKENIQMKLRTVKTLFAVLLIVPLSVFAQGPPEHVPPELVLMHVLDLSQDQVFEIQRLGEERAAAIEPVAFEIQSLHEELAMILESETPDPGQVGEIVLAVRGLEKEIGAQQERFRQGFEAMLTLEQKERVGHINGVALALRAAEALGQLGLR